mmetsp:Transcript_57873/g.187691  ORF Transcript_57873/g.187691 Transcript_57873/m.187691 type:complete len:155 (+) Transcript_57873:73-537(+)
MVGWSRPPSQALTALLSFSLLRSAGALTAEEKEQLDIHNVYRCMHGVPVFTWSAKVAANAQKWADNGLWAHSDNSARTLDGVLHGENLAWGSPRMTAAASVIAWYGEISLTSPYGLVSAFSSGIGHYTQVVWSTSLTLGCAKGALKASRWSGRR